jgi:hypothetical protein
MFHSLSPPNGKLNRFRAAAMICFTYSIKIPYIACFLYVLRYAVSCRSCHYHIRDSHNRNVGVTVDGKLKSIEVQWPRVVWCLCRVWFKSVLKTTDTQTWCYKAIIALMMEAVRTSETLVKLYQSTRRYSPNDSHLSLIICYKIRKIGWILNLNQLTLNHGTDICCTTEFVKWRVTGWATRVWFPAMAFGFSSPSLCPERYWWPLGFLSSRFWADYQDDHLLPF